ncbi:MAG: gamma carbonic anhydrase family protein [Gammaproteobacteria bacterium]|nr:MAG: gamma carbonic anhydrase family protein [Gammaproteobacteria bacterium]
MLYSLADHSPLVAASSYVAPNAAVIGQVCLGEEASVWFNAVIRGDNDSISIGDGSNVQDGAVLHVDDGVPITIGRRVTIGHQAMVHGCTIGDGSLIGINAVILNNAVIGKHCLIGANALVTEGMIIPDNSMVLGSPARTVKPLPPETAMQLDRAAQNYIDRIALYREQLTPLGQG